MVAKATPLFSLGKIVATPGALAAFKVAGESPTILLDRHIRGDWGDCNAEDSEANDRAVIDGGRVLSAYQLGTGVRIWVITEADRSSTCLLLPEEY